MRFEDAPPADERRYLISARLDGPARNRRIGADWSRIVTVFALLLAAFCVAYFGGQLLRGLL